MREKNANDLAVRMYIHGITQQDVADELGMTRAGVGMILSGKRGKKDKAAAEAKIAGAIDAILARRRSA